MWQQIDETLASELLTQLLVYSSYADELMSSIPNIVHLVNKNRQLNLVINNIIEKNDFVNAYTLNKSHIDKRDLRIIQDFFEYLYFTSNTFLSRVE